MNVQYWEMADICGWPVHPDPDVVARRLDDETVLVNLRTNRIYALNRTGGRLWDLIGEGRTRDEVETMLCLEFDVAHDQLVLEIDELLTGLAAAGLTVSST